MKKIFLKIIFSLLYDKKDIFFTGKSENLYCFSYKGSNDGLSLEAGWNFFNIRDEFQRQGVPNEDWAISYLNVNYEVSN